MKVRTLEYGSPEYWTDRYRKEEDDGRVFDWYPGADDILCQEIEKYIPRGEVVLEIGSGSSQLAYKLCQMKYNVFLTDICLNVVTSMKDKWRKMSNIVGFMTLDCCGMPLKSVSLASVVDKGTLDAVDCTDDRKSNVCLREVHRVLGPGGYYFLISCRDPRTRKEDVKSLFDVRSIVEIRSSANANVPCPDAYLYILQKV